MASVCAHPGDEAGAFAAAGRAVLQLDLRRQLGGGEAVLRTFQHNTEEVNSVAASAAGSGWVAAADDAGEVVVMGLAPPAAGQPPACKTLRRGHTNICSAVAFRAHRPWELLSGGLDSAVVRWDFSRLRPLHTWNLAGEAAGGQGAQCAAGGKVRSVLRDCPPPHALWRAGAGSRSGGARRSHSLAPFVRPSRPDVQPAHGACAGGAADRGPRRVPARGSRARGRRGGCVRR